MLTAPRGPPALGRSPAAREWHYTWAESRVKPGYGFSNMTDIRSAVFPEHLAVVQAIFREYADSLDIDLCFQNFEEELAGLPGKYAEPQGRVLLAWQDHQVVGCVAMRPLDATTCEMKRLFVRAAGRGQQLGKRLAEAICRSAKEAGYKRILLDTLPTMQAALRIYGALGFKEIAPYTFTPIEGAKYMALDFATCPGGGT